MKPTLSEAIKPVRLALVTELEVGATGPSLARDVELLKSSVMYADEVELIGMGAAMVEKVCLSPASREMPLARLLRLTEILTGEDQFSRTGMTAPELQAAERLVRSGIRSGDPNTDNGLEQIRTVLETSRQMLRGVQDDIIGKTGGADLETAYAAGVVSVADLGFDIDYLVEQHASDWSGDPMPQVRSWVNAVLERLGDGRTRLLFDRASGEWMRQAIQEGVVPASEIGQRLAGKAAVGAGFLARLPSLPGAPMDELLSIRAELQAPLTRYRGAVARFSQDVAGLFGSDLEAGIEDLWESSGAPGLAEIDEELSSHTFTKELARYLGLEVSDYLATGPLWVGISTLTDLHQAVNATASFATATSGRLVTQAWRERQAARMRVRSNDLFYVHEVERRIST